MIRDGTGRKVEALIIQLSDTIEAGHIIKRAFSKQIHNAKLQLGIWPKRTRKDLAKKLKFGALSPQGKKEAKTLSGRSMLYTMRGRRSYSPKSMLSAAPYLRMQKIHWA